MARTDILDRKSEVIEWINQHRSKAFICAQLRCKPMTLDGYLKIFGVSYKGNQGSKGHKTGKKKTAKQMVSDGFVPSHRLKLRLIEDGIKDARCEICTLDRWMDKPIPLELHHVDENRFNNAFDNLQILCANCHAQMPNNSGRASIRSKS